MLIQSKKKKVKNKKKTLRQAKKMVFFRIRQCGLQGFFSWLYRFFLEGKKWLKIAGFFPNVNKALSIYHIHMNKTQKMDATIPD